MSDLVRHESRKKNHRCKPPNIWRRWREDIGVGSIWRCECGSHYRFNEPGMFTMGFGIWSEISEKLRWHN